MPLGPPDLSSTVLSFSFDVTHRKPGAHVQNPEGYPIAGLATDTTVKAHVYPAPGSVSTLLPDGIALDRTVRGESPSDLWTMGDASTQPSRLVLAGVVYKLFQLSRWRSGAGGVSVRSFLAHEI